MKRLIVLFLLISSVSFGQVKFNFIQSDHVDSLAMSYINVYRNYYHIQSISIDNTDRKIDSKRMSMNFSDSLSVSFIERRTFILKHTKANCSEVLTGNAITSKLVLSYDTNFIIFINKVFRKKISDVSVVDLCIFRSIYNWENSPEHKEIIMDKDNKIGYFSISYSITSTSTRSSFGFASSLQFN